jgi:hypothetical protein
LSTHIRPYLFLPVLALLKGSVLALLLALFYILLWFGQADLGFIPFAQ